MADKFKITQELVDDENGWYEESKELDVSSDPTYQYLLIDGEPVMKIEKGSVVELRDGIELL